MRSTILLSVFLVILPLIVAQKCSKTIRSPYIRSSSRTVGREATCNYKCVLRHKKQINTDYNAIDTCAVDYELSYQTVCCEGFKPNSNNDCEPVCHGCQNGRCIAPNRCVCNEGFQNQSGICVPVCIPECGHGSCLAPGQCSCNEGFTMDSTKGCVPICDPPCQNANCIGSNICECFHGFRKSPEPNECVPDCNPESADCGSGRCIAPNSCACVEGFTFEVNRCVPRCNPACTNGNCTNPNTCTCAEGFVNSSANPSSCIPFCDGGCLNGTCIAPNICQCLPGYHRSNTEPNSCEPSCDPEYVDARNGHCVARNILQCREGFVREFSPVSGRIFCRYPCEAECVNALRLEDGTCHCWAGFSLSKEAANVCEPIPAQCLEVVIQ